MDKIISVHDVLKENLVIPEFQRPYKWKDGEVKELLNDIFLVLNENKKYENYKYRIGTLILYKDKDSSSYEIIDGQQRLITLTLIALAISNKLNDKNIKEYKDELSLLKAPFNNKVSLSNISNNYKFIYNYLSNHVDSLKDIFDAFKNNLEVVVLTVNELSVAFQLFDSQNNRGKELDPHDLLKAYHLREFKDKTKQVEVVNEYESHESYEISKLFSYYLFPIYKRIRKEDSLYFKAQHIDTYKGINKSKYKDYPYVNKLLLSEGYYLLGEEFFSGEDYFKMVHHYLKKVKFIEDELKLSNENSKIDKAILRIINDKDNLKSKGFNHSLHLFKCLLLFYFDRFNSLSKASVKSLFIYSFSIRCDIRNLAFDTINKYVLGSLNEKYTNHIAMFNFIKEAKDESLISSLLIKLKENNKNTRWNDLYNELRNLIKGETI